jgi:competence protein ComEA
MRSNLSILPAMSPLDPQILERINAHVDSRSTRFSALPLLKNIDLALSANQKRALIFVGVAAVAFAALMLLSAQARPNTDVIDASAPIPVETLSPESILVVDVQGEVVTPGVYELPLGARVGDAIKAAGGVRKGSSTSSVNLARFLEDGEQVFVASENAGGSGEVAPSRVAGKLNLNRATESEFDGLPGVGPVLAKRIVDYRSANGNFASVGELQKVSGIGPAKFNELQNFVTV